MGFLRLVFVCLPVQHGVVWLGFARKSVLQLLTRGAC